MKLYKVYSMSVRKSRPIVEISSNEKKVVDRAIFENIDFHVDNSADCTQEDALFEKYMSYFRKNKKIECGDYELIYSDDTPDRPNAIGYCDFYL